MSKKLLCYNILCDEKYQNNNQILKQRARLEDIILGLKRETSFNKKYSEEMKMLKKKEMDGIKELRKKKRKLIKELSNLENAIMSNIKILQIKIEKYEETNK